MQPEIDYLKRCIQLLELYIQFAKNRKELRWYGHSRKMCEGRWQMARKGEVDPEVRGRKGSGGDGQGLQDWAKRFVEFGPPVK